MTKKNDAPKAGDDLTAAKVAEASGAIIEPEMAKIPDHPSVDNNPRAGVPAASNAIDFNEPSALTPQEQMVADNLKNG